MVALSLSRVISGVSTSMESPGVTSTSITSMFSKSPILGTQTVSTVSFTEGLGSHGLEQQSSRVFKRRHDKSGNPCSFCAVDDPVIIGEIQR